MDGRIRVAVVLWVGLLAGGCFHSDYHRSGYAEDGMYWSERVADHVGEPYVGELRDEILALGEAGEVDPVEAQLLAETAIRHGMELARSYGMVRPIEIHNTLVNLGLRPRGLCYQTAEDMYVRLRELHLKSLQLHWGVAHKDDMWLEHSGVIVTARGRPFDTGLVLDAWRHSGRLRWAAASQDRYPWVEMLKDKFPELRQQAVQEAELAAGRMGGTYLIDSRAGAGPMRAECDPATGEAASAEPVSGERAARPAATTAPPRPGSVASGQSSAIVTRPRSE